MNATPDNTAFPSGLEWFTITRADGTEDTDCQCARCGSSVLAYTCEACGGDGEVEDDRDWNLGGLLGMYMRCRTCNGTGEYLICASGSEWCHEHPLPGREDVIGA